MKAYVHNVYTRWHKERGKGSVPQCSLNMWQGSCRCRLQCWQHMVYVLVGAREDAYHRCCVVHTSTSSSCQRQQALWPLNNAFPISMYRSCCTTLSPQRSQCPHPMLQCGRSKHTSLVCQFLCLSRPCVPSGPAAPSAGRGTWQLL